MKINPRLNIGLEKLADQAEFDDETLRTLLRSLSTRRTVSFFGAGISIPYGAGTWDQLIDDVRGRALKAIILATHQPGLDPQTVNRLKRLEGQLEDLKKAPRNTPEQNLTQMELIRLAFDLAQSPDDKDTFHEAIAQLTKSDLLVARKNASLRLSRLKRGLVADKSRSVTLQEPDREFLNGKLALALNVESRADKASQEEKKTKAEIDLGRSNGNAASTSDGSHGDAETKKQRFLFQNFYTVELLETLLSWAHSEPTASGGTGSRAALSDYLEEIIDGVRADAERAGRDVKAGGLPPDRRSFFSLIFATLILYRLSSSDMEESFDLLFNSITRENTSKPIHPDFAASEYIYEDGDNSDITATAGELRPRSDPIHEIVKKLDFWRFLSTNYDYEVEKYFEFLNYPRGTLSERADIDPQPVPERVDPQTGRRVSRSWLGEAATSDVISPNSIGELIDFSTCSSDMGARVMHLHGRADLPGTIIATESDYQTLYLNEREKNFAFGYALDIIFSGNPILFIGSSISEQDLLRPLREFASNRSIEDRDLYALMPAIDPVSVRTAKKVEAFIRYGVRILFYGEQDKQKAQGSETEDDAFDVKDPDDAAEEQAEVQFIPRQLGALDYDLKDARQEIDRLRGHIAQLVKCLDDDPDPSKNNPVIKEKNQQAYAYLSKVDEVKHDGSEPEENINGRAFFRFDRVFPDHKKTLVLASDELTLRLTLKALSDYLLSLQREAGFTDVVDVTAVKIYLKDTSPSGEFDGRRLGEALMLIDDFLEKLKGEVITVALNRAIEDLADLKSQWWRDVRLPPPMRSTSDWNDHGNAQQPAIIANRQRAVWPNLRAEDYDETIKPLLERLKLDPDASGVSTSGRLLYCFSKKGMGKGSFFHILTSRLQDQNPHQSLAWIGRQYTHHWAANFSHTLEFSSALVGITNLLKKQCVDAGLIDNDEAHRIRNRRGHLHLASQLVTLMCEQKDKGHYTRSIFVFAGFDCLLNQEGRFRTVEVDRIFKELIRAVKESNMLDVIIVSGRGEGSRNVFANEPLPKVPAANGSAHSDDHTDDDTGEPAKLWLGPTLKLHDIQNLSEDRQKAIFPKARASGAGDAYLIDILRPENPNTPMRPLPEVSWEVKASRDIYDDWEKAYREVRRNIGRSRYLKKLLEHVLDDISVWEPYLPGTKRFLEGQTYWLKRLTDRIQASSAENISSRVIHSVLERYGLQVKTKDGSLDYDSRIDFLVLKTISYFGFPTEGHVLMRVPQLKTYLMYNVRRLHGTNSVKKSERDLIPDCIKLLEASLDRLLKRHLIGAVSTRCWAKQRGQFEKSAQKSAVASDASTQTLTGQYSQGEYAGWDMAIAYEQAWKNDWCRAKQLDPDGLECPQVANLRHGYRYVLHPAMKRFVTSNYTFRTPEHSFTNTYVLSIFATQPTDVMVLDETVQDEVDGIIDSLNEAWRCYTIQSLEDMNRPGPHADGLPVEKDQIDRLRKVALGHKLTEKELSPEDDIDNFDVASTYMFRAKTIKGLLARASADMPACFRASYGVLRQLRPFAVLVRTEKNAEAIVESGYQQSPFDRTANRLKTLQEGAISARQARQVITDTRSRPHDGLTYDQEIVKPYVDKPDDYTKHPINTFGPLTVPEEALYPHELAWLWNERGVIAFAQGRLYDALPYYNLALKSIRKHEGDPDPLGPSTVRIWVNIAICEIERGNLRRANTLLQTVIDYARSVNDLSHEPEGFAKAGHVIGPVSIGYQGLVKHLSGDISGAIKRYDQAIDELEPQNRRRALSIFYKHRADAYGVFRNAGETVFNMDGKDRDPMREIDRSISAAQSMMQLDQLHFARLSKVRLLLMDNTTENQREAATVIAEVLKYAESMNLFRLQSEALHYDARLKYLQKEYNVASRSASESVGIATRHGMKMRRISSSIILGKIFWRNGDRDTAITILNDANRDAQKAKYQLAIERTQAALFELSSEAAG